MNNQRLKTSIPVAVCFLILALFGIESLRVGASKRRPGEHEVAFQPTYSASINAVARRTNDLVFHVPSQRVYASVPSGSDSIGNSIAKIDPTTGAIEQSVWVGSEPNKLALASDESTLYVGLDGARAIRRVDLTTLTPGQQIQAGYDNLWGPLKAVDFAVSPINSGVVAVSRTESAGSSSRGIAVFDNNNQRSNTGGASAAITFGESETTLFGNTFYSGELQKMTINASGVESVTNTPGGGGKLLKFVGGRLYNSYGKIIDPANGSLIGTFPFVDASQGERPFAVDTQSHRAFFAAHAYNGLLVSAYDTDTFVLIGSVTLDGITGDARTIVRWGTNGLAISVKDGLTFFIQSDLVGIGTTLPPVPIPTPTPSPTPSMPFLRRIDILNNDILYNQTDGKIYLTVPGLAGPGIGNTITRINPVSGAVVSSTFIGSEPTKLVMSDDGVTLYSVLNGPYFVRRFDTVTQTAGPQFNVPNGNFPIKDILILPGSPGSVAVATGNGGVEIYDNGIPRPVTANFSSGNLELSAVSNVIYTLDEYSTSTLTKLGIDANGLNVIDNSRNLIAGPIFFNDGRVYNTRGSVVDPESKRILGEFRIPGSTFGGSSIAVDSVGRKAFLLADDGIFVFDLDTYNPLGTIPYPRDTNQSVTLTSLVRWGTNGLAFRARTSNGISSIYIVQSPLVSATGTIPIGYSLERSSLSAYEGSGNVTINISRGGNTSIASSVDYATVDGTAVGGSDYGVRSGTLNFAPGETSKQVTIPIVNDSVYEGNEIFSFVLSNPTGPDSEILSPGTCSILLGDNESRPSISIGSVSVQEPVPGGSAGAEVQVQLSSRSVETVTVEFSTIDGTAFAGSDYVSINGMLTFAPLETIKTIRVQILGDYIPEGNESFVVILSNPVNSSGLQNSASVITIQNLQTSKSIFDFDGDRKTDLSIFRPNGAASEWWWVRSSGGNGALQFGASTDNIAAADYTGDGKTDVAFWRSSTGQWFVLRSEDFSFYAIPFGSNGDVPVPGDFDGDGKADAAVFRESSQTWYISRSAGGTDIVGFGSIGDKPVVADYDGDGKADIAVFRPNGANGAEWWIRNSSNGAMFATQFGSSTDKAVPADYTGDGKADIAFWTPSSGNWFVLRSEDYSYFAFPFGMSTDIPTPGDYDGDGKTDAAVFRPSDSTWYAQRSTAGLLIQQFGAAGDVPVPSAYVR